MAVCDERKSEAHAAARDVGTEGGTALMVALIDTETTYPRPFRASWTPSPDRTMMSSNPE